MKKFVFIVLVLAILAGVAYLLKNQPATSTEENEVVAEDVVVVDQEPAAGEAVVVVDEEPATEEEVVAEEVVEENPEETADEGETVVE